MKTLAFLVAAAFCAAVSAAEGPGVSEADFFAGCVDCSIPALAEIPAKTAAGDYAAAEKIFADYVRSSLDWRKVYPSWAREKLTKKGLHKLAASADKIMDYRLSACGVPYHFKDRKIDWEFNPTYNGYREWPWQLGRQPFFTTLARYYAATGDEKAAETWRDMISGWIAQAVPPPDGTPPSRPVTWRTLDAGLRVAGWCRQIHAFARSPALSDEFIVRFFRSVRDHGHRLENRSRRTTGA